MIEAPVAAGPAGVVVLDGRCAGRSRSRPGDAVSYRGLVLPAAAAARLDARGRDLRWTSRSPASRSRPRDRCVSSSRTGRTLGLALADPENERLRVLVRGRRAVRGDRAALFAAPRRAGARPAPRARPRRRAHAPTARSTAPATACPAFTADVLAPWAVVYVYGRGSWPTARRSRRRSSSRRGCAAASSRCAAAARRARAGCDRRSSARRRRQALVVEERGVPFEVHLERGLNTGLFTDMREHRHGLRASPPASACSTASPTPARCPSLAARAGAAAVTSVDLSGGVQAWAQDNFRLSGLDPGRPSASRPTTSARFLDGPRREDRRYDLVLLDPPAFSAARGAEFALDRDYPDADREAPHGWFPSGGLLWLACNARTSSLARRSPRAASPRRGAAPCCSSTGGLPRRPPRPCSRSRRTATCRSRCSRWSDVVSGACSARARSVKVGSES